MGFFLGETRGAGKLWEKKTEKLSETEKKPTQKCLWLRKMRQRNVVNNATGERRRKVLSIRKLVPTSVRICMRPMSPRKETSSVRFPARPCSCQQKYLSARKIETYLHLTDEQPNWMCQTDNYVSIDLFRLALALAHFLFDKLSFEIGIFVSLDLHFYFQSSIRHVRQS